MIKKDSTFNLFAIHIEQEAVLIQLLSSKSKHELNFDFEKSVFMELAKGTLLNFDLIRGSKYKKYYMDADGDIKETWQEYDELEEVIHHLIESESDDLPDIISDVLKEISYNIVL
jgi:hypothetical protein